MEDEMKRKLIAILLAALLVLALAACSGGDGGKTTNPTAAPAPAGEKLTMGTGGESGTYYAFGGVLANYIGQNSDLSINVVSTGGTAANITGIHNGLYDLATVQSDVSTYAYFGTNSFEGNAISDFRVLGALYAETVQIVTCNSALTSVADLKGKSVCVGDVGSGTYFNTVDVLAAYDMTLDDITPVYQSFGDSTESIKDGKIDAAFICAGAPTNAVVDLATSKSVYLISIDDEHMTKLLASCPWYASLTIPAGTYNSLSIYLTTYENSYANATLGDGSPITISQNAIFPFTIDNLSFSGSKK